MNLKSFSFLTILIFFLCSFQQPTYAYHAESDTAMQNDILVYINKYRQKHGLTPLKMDQHIVHEAIKHSQDMANHRLPFGHDRFMSRVKTLKGQIKNVNGGAENVAYNYTGAQDVVQNWLQSSGHKKNIDGHYNLTGVGIARDRFGKIYFTQIFLNTGARSHVAQQRHRSNPFILSWFKR